MTGAGDRDAAALDIDHREQDRGDLAARVDVHQP